MKKIIWGLSLMLLTLCASGSVYGQKKQKQTEPEGYKFTIVKDNPATPVKNQSRSGTCWSFSGNGLLESELLRMGKGEVDLSDMWIVRHTYMDKAEKYVRMHGEVNFSGGGAFHDVFNVIRKYGIVPGDVYKGLGYGMDIHNHAELDNVLSAYVKAVVQNRGRQLTTAWMDGFNGILDAYFGPVPEKFTYNGKEYTPQSYAAELGLNMDDYINITSFTHHPFYTRFAIEIPDNWAWGLAYNLPMEEMMQVLDYAIDNGFTAAWGADVSEKGFAYRKGLAVVPETELDNMAGTEQARWVAMTPADREKAIYTFDQIVAEKKIDQQARQLAFDNYQTTDDHGMVITGTATDQNDSKYYRVKNSWGTEDHIYGGYFYASVPFVEYKTINIVVHRDAIPAAIKQKLGIR